MNYFLVLNGHPPITIHQEDCKDYYAALETWDERQELAPMEAFLRVQTVKTWENRSCAIVTGATDLQRPTDKIDCRAPTGAAVFMM